MKPCLQLHLFFVLAMLNALNPIIWLIFGMLPMKAPTLWWQQGRPLLSTQAPVLPHPSSIRHGDGRFTGSLITHLSDAMDLVENVCVMDTHDVGGDIVSYTLGGASFALEAGASWAPAWPELRFTSGRTLDQWDNDTISGMVLYDYETLLLHKFDDGNPAHCLSDLVFSLGTDVRARTRARTSSARNGQPFYPKFLYKDFFKILDGCPTNDWCCELLRSTGLIDPSTGTISSIRRATESEPHRNRICFKRLLVPRLAHFRFPSAKNGEAQTVRWLQGEAFNSMRLTSKPWDVSNLTKEVPILLYDRKGTSRRVWTNAADVQNLLEQNYQAKVIHWGEAWGQLNYTEQALLYHHHPLIIAPHGAHLSNLLFARPETQVVEIQCSTVGSPPKPVINLTKKDDTKDPAVEWYGVSPPTPGNEFSWFTSISRSLSIEHFLYIEHEGCSNYSASNPRKDYSPFTFTVDPATFVSFIVSRFGLKARE